MSAYIVPPVSQVTATEASQSGLSAGNTRKVTDAQKTRIDRFIKAHLGKITTKPATVTEQAKTAALGRPQVSADEQAAALALMGGSRHNTLRRSSSKNVGLYQDLFKSDENYLEIDLQDFQSSLLNKGQSLVDLSNWPEPQKALRKYVLTLISLERPGSDKNLIRLTQKSQVKLLGDHGEYIRGSIAAVLVGQELKLSPLKLKDFVRAYQMLDMPQNDARIPELIHLFKTLRKPIDEGRGTEEMVKMCNNLYAVLKREKSQSPGRATSTRQYLILSRIKQLQTLTLTKSRHTEFLNTCKKAKLYALPTLVDLMTACLQITIAGETIVGVNNLMKLASAVSTQKPGAQDMFVPHYSKFVLQSDQLQGLFKSNFHQKQVSDHILKSIKSTGILTEGPNAPVRAN